jgi:hypothetical protein
MSEETVDVGEVEVTEVVAETAAKPKPVKSKKMRAPKSDFNLDALAKEVNAEDTSKPFTFTYGSKNWTMRPAGQSDARILAKVDVTDTQQVMLYIKDLLGDEQWDEFPRITLAVALKLLDAYMEHTNSGDLGE